MTSQHPKGLFITGTGTGVGKTHVAAAIARQLASAGRRVGVYKPAASGCRQENGLIVADDAVALWQAAGCPGELDRVCPQRFLAPLAPHLAARAEGRTLDAALLRTGLAYWTERSEVVVVEGAGGLMAPLGEEEYVADLVADFEFPLVVVAANELGTVNHTLQTLIAAASFSEGLPIAGVVLNHPRPAENDPSTLSNRAELELRCVPPVLAALAHGATGFDRHVDWYALAGSES